MFLTAILAGRWYELMFMHSLRTERRSDGDSSNIRCKNPPDRALEKAKKANLAEDDPQL